MESKFKISLATAVLNSFKRLDRDNDSYCIHCNKDFVYWGKHEKGCVVEEAKRIADIEATQINAVNLKSEQQSIDCHLDEVTLLSFSDNCVTGSYRGRFCPTTGSRKWLHGIKH